MSINIDTQDITQYPGNIKRVTVDQTKIVPINNEGDEVFVTTISTNAYSDNTVNTAIADLYIMDLTIGWAKSSGLTGTAGKYLLDATNNTMGVKMDATVSGTSQTGYYQITLDYNPTTPKSGEEIAKDIEEKIRAITCEIADRGFQLAYTNCSVEYRESKFWIVSGSFADAFIGPYRSSCAVVSGTTNDCTGILGFTNPVTSEELDDATTIESLVTADYTADDLNVYINTGTGIVAGDCCSITDGSTTDYFTVLGVADNGATLTVPTSGTNSFVGIVNNYTTGNYTRIQVLREQDPDTVPQSYVNSIDGLVKYGLKSIINQIDYSS